MKGEKEPEFRKGESMTKFFQTRPLPGGISTGLLLLRLVVGLAFMFHGYGKIQHPFGWMGPNASMPGVLQALAAISEFGGGLAWILGLITPLACLGLLCTMTVATYTCIAVFHFPFVSKSGGGSFELSSVYFCVALLLLLAGPGRFSLDQVLFGGKPTSTSLADQNRPEADAMA
jgi:putative oxidoreductase